MSERVGRLPLRGAKPRCSPPLPKQPSKLKRSDAVVAVAVRSGGFGTVGVGFRAKCRNYISLVYKIRPAPRACPQWLGGTASQRGWARQGLAVLTLQRLQLLCHIRRNTGRARLRRAADLRRNRAYRRPARSVLAFVRPLSRSDVFTHSVGRTGIRRIEELGPAIVDIEEFALPRPAIAERVLVARTDRPTGEPDLPPGRGDQRRLTQVLLNLVGNAIKFTDAGEVVITASASNGTFNLAVHDTGPGISVTDQAKLFQEFHQADNSITRRKGGTGLGLAMSKRIIEMHGGQIWVESVVGQGSTFFVTVPVEAQEQAKPPST
jgi:signal transduction histidine kinase